MLYAMHMKFSRNRRTEIIRVNVGQKIYAELLTPKIPKRFNIKNSLEEVWSDWFRRGDGDDLSYRGAG